MYYVYLLQSKLNKEIYIGSTNNFEKRLAEHNAGQEISTQRYVPWEIVYYEAYQDEKAARIREKRLKYNGNAIRELKKRIGIASYDRQKEKDSPSTTFTSDIHMRKAKSISTTRKPQDSVLSKSGAGFTIIELIISMGVFVVLIGIVSGIFISSLRVQRSLVALMAANDNTSLTLEQMAREMRVGRNFGILPLTLTPPRASGDSISFDNASGETVSYIVKNNILEKGICSGSVCDNENNYIYKPITSENVEIKNLYFDLVHLSLLGNWPPRIMITMEVGSKEITTQNLFTQVQTTISGRNF